jgi:hypothetical protein
MVRPLRALLLLAVMVVLADAGSAYGQELSIETGLDPSGNPQLAASYETPSPGVTPTLIWSVCGPPTMQCTPMSSGATFAPGPEPAGTSFQLTENVDGQSFSAGSPQWNGALTVAQPPTIVGELRVGNVASPSPATWTGGFGPTTDTVGIEACRQPTTGSCVLLSDTNNAFAPHDSPNTRIGGWFTGWFLRAFDQHAQGFPIAGVGLGGPLTGYAPPAANALTSVSAAVGPIAGPPAPTVHPLRHAVIRGRTVLLSRVRCASRCPVVFFGLPRGGPIVGVRAVAGHGESLVGVPVSDLRGRRRISFAVQVSGGPPLRVRAVVDTSHGSGAR